jgi:hypothetical protein
MKKRRHHYVWQKYLKPWEVGGQIWCRRADKSFPTSTVNIGQQRDFYRLKELTEEEIAFIRKVAIDPTTPNLRTANEEWIETFQLVFKIRRLLISQGMAPEVADELLDVPTNNLEEDLHEQIEAKAIDLIDQILRGDVSFYSQPQGRLDFSHFLAVQYMRTKRVQDSFCESFKQAPISGSIRLEHCWPAMRHIFATNMGFKLFAESTIFHMVLLRNTTPTPFITGDQPVLNTYAAGKLGKEITQETEFYYPVAPSLAILVSKRPDYQLNREVSLKEEQVGILNRAIAETALEQVYANQEDALLALGR